MALTPFITTEPYKRAALGQPLGLVLDTVEMRTAFSAEPYKRSALGQPLGLELDATELQPTFTTEPRRSQPFIDSLTPVTVGSDWRDYVMRAAKLDDTATLPVLVPQPGAVLSPLDTISIPCGDRIPEFADARSNPLGYTPPAGVPGLLDDRTIILFDSTAVYMNSAPLNGWGVASVANLINGFNYTLTAPAGVLPIGSHTLSVYLEGVESFQDLIAFDVSDLTGPVITAVDPVENATDVGKTDPIKIRITDDIGVTLSSIVISVRGVLVYDGSTDEFTSGWLDSSYVANGSGGFNFTLVPIVALRWRNKEVVDVHVEASDSSNTTIKRYSFTRIEFRPRIYLMLVNSLRDKDEG